MARCAFCEHSISQGSAVVRVALGIMEMGRGGLYGDDMSHQDAFVYWYHEECFDDGPQYDQSLIYIPRIYDQILRPPCAICFEYLTVEDEVYIIEAGMRDGNDLVRRDLAEGELYPNVLAAAYVHTCCVSNQSRVLLPDPNGYENYDDLYGSYEDEDGRGIW